MSRIHLVFLCAVVMVMMITAGCTFPNTSGAQPLVTGTETPVSTPVPTASAAGVTSPPGAAGTQAPGTCAADTQSDAANCGGCGYACPANALCQAGQCFCKEGYTVENNACVAAPAGTGTGTESGTGCPTGMSPCPDGYCYELSSSAENCGICGNMCPAGMICSASTCTNAPAGVTTEPTTEVTTDTTTSSGSGSGLGTGGFRCFGKGQTNCGGTCVNLSTSASNCGACKNSCTFTKYPSCCGGACVNTKTDTSNCGTCGKKCGIGATCESGICKTKYQVGGIYGTGLVKVSIKPVDPLQKVIDPSLIGIPGH